MLAAWKGIVSTTNDILNLGKQLDQQAKELEHSLRTNGVVIEATFNSQPCACGKKESCF